MRLSQDQSKAQRELVANSEWDVLAVGIPDRSGRSRGAGWRPCVLESPQAAAIHRSVILLFQAGYDHPGD